LLLIDNDRVEETNLRRQNFFKGDVGKFKSQALAERLSRQYGLQIGYSVNPFDAELLHESIGGGLHRMIRGILIGCVDNADARRSIAKNNSWNTWWVDAGNGYDSGQVLLGNARTEDDLKEAFSEYEETVKKLPIPSLQLPALLAPAPKVKVKRNCAEAVQAEEQSPTINQAMAGLVVDLTYRLLKGTLAWMGVYIDLEAGTRSVVPAQPDVVARMMSIRKELLMENKCGLGHRYHV